MISSGSWGLLGSSGCGGAGAGGVEDALAWQESGGGDPCKGEDSYSVPGVMY